MKCDIAVISMACRFPGAKTVAEFWQNLKNGKETIRNFTPEELRAVGIAEHLIHNDNYIRRRGILADIEYFAYDFFNIPPYEASITDPQQRIFLEICWEALEQAGYLENNPEIAVGVFAGCGDNTYLPNSLKQNREFLQNQLAYQTNIVNSSHFLTTKISYLLNLKGPSITVATGCSTSLVAIIQACQALTDHTCDLALAGGITIRVPQSCGYLYQEGSIYAKDGKCRAFAADASGTVPSNGAGVVVLKRLADAIRDHDHIAAVIKSHAINNDGAAKAGYTAPSVLGQTHCIATALSQLDDINKIAYIETHGTGTILGDPLEITALTQAFSFYTEQKNFAALGSVKTNIGHTDVAAGVAGLIKTVLVLQHRAIPPLINFTTPNPNINLSATPFYFGTQYQSLADFATPLYAGVSSFGIGGTNAHLILATPPPYPKTHNNKTSYLLPLSAQNKEALQSQENNLLTYIAEQPEAHLELSNIAYTLQIRRTAYSERKAIVCSEVAELKQLLQDTTNANILTSTAGTSANRQTVFLFQGQGTLYPGCVAELYREVAPFKEYFHQCCHYLETNLADQILAYATTSDYYHSDDNTNPLLQQLTTFIIEYSLAKTYNAFGIKPDILLGHSLGEYSAICLAEALSLPDTIKLIQLRAKLIKELPPGLMVAVPAAATTVRNYITTPEVTIASDNSPTSCVISGSITAIKNLQKRLEQEILHDKQYCTVLPLPYAFHSPAIDSILAPFTAASSGVKFSPATTPILSTVTGRLLHPISLEPKNHFSAQLRDPVLFSSGITTLINNGAPLFLEIGVGQTLSILVKQHNTSLPTITSLPRSKEATQSGVSQYRYFNRALGACWCHQLKVDWQTYQEVNNQQPYQVPLPSTPFTKKYCWISPTPQAPLTTAGPFIYETYWQLAPAPKLDKVVEPQTWLIFADPHGIATQFSTQLAREKHQIIIVTISTSFAHLTPNHYQLNPTKPEDYKKLVNLLWQNRQLPQQIVHLWSSTAPSPSDPTTAKRELQHGFFSLINFMQNLLATPLSTQPSLTIITNKLKAITQGEELIAEKSTLLGLALTLPQETSILTRVIDTDLLTLPPAQQSQIVSTLLHETTTKPTDPIIIYRNNLRFVRRFSQYQPAATPAKTNYLSPRGTYLISGGLGKIGLAVAEFLAVHYHAHLILISRNPQLAAPPNSQAANQLATIKKAAASLTILTADIADSAQMEQVLATIKTTFPTITGVFQLAAVLNSSTRTLIKNITPKQAYTQFRPKIDGTKVLYTLVEALAPKFCVAFSSLAAIIGGVELGSYAASNNSLDSLVEAYQGSAKTRWLSINWDAWHFTTAHQPSKPNSLAVTQGLELLQTILHSTQGSQFIVTATELPPLIAKWVNYAGTPQPPTTPTPAATATKSSSPATTESLLQQLFANCLGVKTVAKERDFYELGGDSLALLRLHEMINKNFPNQIKMVELIRHRSVTALSKLLEKNRTPAKSSSNLVTIKATGTKQPIFLIHPVGGTVFCYVDLAKYLTINHPLLAIQDPALTPEQLTFTSIEETATYYLSLIKSVQTDTNYLIGGYSFGANVAFALASQLEQQGKKVQLFLIDGWAKYSAYARNRDKNRATMQKIITEINTKIPTFIQNNEQFIALLWKRMELLFGYTPKKIAAQIILFKAATLLPEYQAIDEATNHWQKYSTNPVNSYTIPGDHLHILKNNGSKQIATILNKYLES